MKTTVEDIRREFQPGLPFKDGVEVLKRWKSEGRAQLEVIVAMLELHRELIAQHGRESQEVTIHEDWMDLVWGHCPRDKRIWDTSLQTGPGGTIEISPRSDGT